jgi:hypothetical protein
MVLPLVGIFADERDLFLLNRLLRYRQLSEPTLACG